MRLHVHPSAVLLVPCFTSAGIQVALLQEGVGDLVVNVLLCSTFWFASCAQDDRKLVREFAQVPWF
jgi:hypothetical protein